LLRCFSPGNQRQRAGHPYRPGLRGAGTFVINNRAAFTEQQFLRATTKFRNTIDAEVVFCGFVFQQILLAF
jgi:hypothetical protein